MQLFKFLKEIFWKYLGKKRMSVLFLSTIDHLSRVSDDFYAYDKWPKKSDPRENLYIYQVNRNLEQIGIIIQGPLKHEDNFTLETVEYYRKLFPTAILIISTWRDENKETLEQLKKAGAHIVVSELPEVRGVANVNCQIKSTMAGICYAEQLGLKHILKTRSDQRIYAWNSLRYFFAVNKVFPVASGSKTRERLIIVNEFTRKFTPFHFSDFLMFGTVEDVKLYWDQPFSTINERGSFAKISEINENNCAEVFLGKNFMRKVASSCQYTIAEYHRFLRDYFYIVDLQQLDLYWHWGQKWALMLKFGVRHLSAKYKSDMCINSSDWLHIYQNGDELSLPENIFKEQKHADDVLLTRSTTDTIG